MKVQLTVRFLNWAGYSPSKGQTSTLLLLNIESINPATKNKNHTWRITTLSWKAASGKAMLVTIMSSDATATSPSKKLRTAVPTTKKQEEDMRNCSPVSQSHFSSRGNHEENPVEAFSKNMKVATETTQRCTTGKSWLANLVALYDPADKGEQTSLTFILLQLSLLLLSERSIAKLVRWFL